jgi:hypothetical protein
MALRERNSALHWAATRPEDNTPAVAVAVGHFVQVGQRLPTFSAPIEGSGRGTRHSEIGLGTRWRAGGLPNSERQELCFRNVAASMGSIARQDSYRYPQLTGGRRRPQFCPTRNITS